MIEFEVIKLRLSDNHLTPAHCKDIRALMVRGGNVLFREQVFDMIKTGWYRFYVQKGSTQSELVLFSIGIEHYLRTASDDTPEDVLLHLPTF